MQQTTSLSVLKILLFAGYLVLVTACSSPEEKTEEYLSSAVYLFEEGKLEKSEIQYRNALRINESLPDAWFGLAKIYERKQDWQQVYGVLSKFRELAPDHIDGRLMLAQIVMASNQIDQALADAREILEMAPGDARSHSMMAAVQFRLNNIEGAQQEVARALAIDSANPEAILVRASLLIADKKHNQAIAALDKAITSNSDNVSLYLMKIRAYQETGDSQAIDTIYLSLVKRFPDNALYKNTLARRYIVAGKIDAAERLIQQVVAANPADVKEKLGLVSFKFRHRSIDDAVTLLKNYIEADKNEYRYRLLLGELYEKNKQPGRAKTVYQSIVADDELRPNGLEARNRIAFLELRDGRHDDARKLVNDVLAQDENNEKGLLLLASFHIADQNYDDAVMTARTVLRDNPDSIKALALLAKAYSAKRTPELAVETYLKAFQLSPGIPEIANQLALALIRQRKHAQADEILQQSILRGNRSVEALKLLVQTRLALGEWGKAELVAKQLQKLEGQEAFSHQMLGLVYQGKDQQDESIDAFRRAHELSPGATQPVVALVRSYVRSGKIDEAKSFLDSVLSVDSNNVSAHLLLGQLSLAERDFPEATRYFGKVIEINPDSDVGYRSLARLYQLKNDLGSAKKVIYEGLAVMPDRPILLMSLASVHEADHEIGQAISIYENLLKKNPDLVVAKNNFASLLTDHQPDAMSLAKARQISSELKSSQIPQFRDTYAWASVISGTNLEEAVVILEDIVRENEQVDVYNYHLGEAYRKKGNPENALAYLTRAMEQARPGSDIAIKATQSLERLKQP